MHTHTQTHTHKLRRGRRGRRAFGHVMGLCECDTVPWNHETWKWRNHKTSISSTIHFFSSIKRKSLSERYLRFLFKFICAFWKVCLMDSKYFFQAFRFNSLILICASHVKTTLYRRRKYGVVNVGEKTRKSSSQSETGPDLFSFHYIFISWKLWQSLGNVVVRPGRITCCLTG